ncbi:MAG: glycosyl transferase, family 2 [Nocardioides sp.]|jgi:glycosyltransferase involved in cell wall biosynthesis|uniref:glycosyltransferase family 2 protein n=1 Tax=Nocardioides sp. TaxID=35761 RepID=UPI0026281AE3|nr:glycosyltransferase family 2 protein [Nocardioides sp.]MCW2832119.1 glycosyl transferase, family 2 [Nocardioides sp.]
MGLLRRRHAPTVSVVVPAYGVEAYLPACLDSLLAQHWQSWQAIVVDDGSPDRSGEIAEAYASRDARIRVVHVENGGLGSARNVGARHADADFLAFLDSDDVLPRDALASLTTSLLESGSDFATGSIVRWEQDGLHEPPWMKRLHSPARGLRIAERPEILGDVFAWNKVFRRSFWDDSGLDWPEGIRYEDQPTTTRAFMAGTFDVLPAIVYHWRIRDDGSSITQQRSSVRDLTDRWTTKRMAYAAVRSAGDRGVEDVFQMRVLAGDLWRYFLEIPAADDEWWTLLRDGVREFWGDDGSLTGSGLPPVHRLCGWLVEHDRRAEAAALMTWVASLDGPAPQTGDGSADHRGRHVDVPSEVLDLSTVAPAALALRSYEMR